MKIERRKPEVKPAEPTIWEQRADSINDPGTWEKVEHSHDVTDPGHSHGNTTQRQALAAFNYLNTRMVELRLDGKAETVEEAYEMAWAEWAKFA